MAKARRGVRMHVPIPPAYSSMRLFKPTQERDGGVMRSVYRLTCSTCGSTDKMVCNHPSGLSSKEVVFKHFEDAGWSLGPTEDRTKCPACLNREDEARRADAERKKMSAKTDAPRVMTYEDAKRVRAAIKEVYLTDCYSGSESDDSVAARIVVPPQWVKEVRGSEFGPGENEDFKVIAPQVTAIQTDLQKCKDNVDKAMSLLAETDSRVLALTASLRDLNKRADGIAKNLR